MDCLFQFSILKEAVMTIGKEGKDFVFRTLSNLGGKYFQLFKAWVVFLLVQTLWGQEIIVKVWGFKTVLLFLLMLTLL